MLKIYQQPQPCGGSFRSPRSGAVRMYVCGITVYDYSHLGHARMMIAFDIVQRCCAQRLSADLCAHITDIDDKHPAARRRRVSLSRSHERFIRYLDEDAARGLRCRKPDLEPRAQVTLPSVGDGPKIGGARYRLSGKRRCEFLSPEVSRVTASSRGSRSSLRAGERVEVDTTKARPDRFRPVEARQGRRALWHSPGGTGVRAGT